MNSIRASPTPSLGRSAVLNARSGLPRLTMIWVRGRARSADVGAVHVEPHRAVVDPPVSPSAHETVTMVAVRARRGGVAGADDGRDAELAGDDGRVAGPPAAVGDDGRRGLHDRLPVRGRWCRRPAPRRARNSASWSSCVDDAHRARWRSCRRPQRPSARTSPRLLEHVALQCRRRCAGTRPSRGAPGRCRACRRCRPWPTRCPSACRSALDGAARSRRVRARRRPRGRSGARSAFGVGTLRVVSLVSPSTQDHLHGLVAEQAPQHGAVACEIGRLVDVELVRVDGALDDVLAEAVGAGDEDDVAVARTRCRA